MAEQESPRRLRWASRAFAKMVFSGVEVSGRENLAGMADHRKIIFVSTHISDLDIPVIVAALSGSFDLAVTDISIHKHLLHSLMTIDPTYLAVLLAGRKNFLSITYSLKNGVRKGHLNPDDIININNSLDGGKAVIISAHNPTFDGKLPDNPGYAAVLAALTANNSIVVPVAVQIGDGAEVLGIGTLSNMIKTIRRRPSVKVVFGSPVSFDSPVAKEAARDILLTGRYSVRPAEAFQIIREEAQKVMRTLAAMLPVQKRGNWEV